ncbi:CBS domain-containing protein [Brevundimonas sp. 3P9-tot-E]|uniref:CBS domain-containing protein n=1 Tax=Brevundimonas TaxID=41275 RepID=UPI000F7B1B9B|nr:MULTISPECIES: CBS domain-containing protein [Brevundimonas]MDA0744572.1 CBS domain-containing protein [Pseudomonadota bacterium]MBK1969150.1 CBS domain-containing protein [Brevundimonas diminuta]MBK1974455.1 CBS domain-containing protein [Brevundimonas diminuta]MDA1321840.1 CBS domain-containing protein [Pseudomonadota bacterium]MDM8353226.1 CBS domain-containing protein [Brevundimonas diminuta]
MKIRDVMSKDVQVARPEDTLQNVAGRMAAGDFGFIPVADGDRLIGALTDRDIVVRAVASGAGPEARVLDVLSRDALVVRADDDLKVALDLMSSRQIRRLPVVDKDGRLVGVVSLGDLSTRVKERYAGEALEEISRPG